MPILTAVGNEVLKIMNKNTLIKAKTTFKLNFSFTFICLKMILLKINDHALVLNISNSVPESRFNVFFNFGKLAPPFICSFLSMPDLSLAKSIDRMLLAIFCLCCCCAVLGTTSYVSIDSPSLGLSLKRMGITCLLGL